MPEYVAAAQAAYAAFAAAIGVSTATLTTIITVAAMVYGNVQQRSAARKMAAAQRDAYNAALTDRTVSIVSADNPWQVIYGEPSVPPAYVAILTSGDRDQFKHLVAVWAAHECDAITDALLAGVSIGALDVDGYVTGGKWAKPETVTASQEVVLNGATPVAVVFQIGALLSVSTAVGSGADIEWRLLPLENVIVSGNTLALVGDYPEFWVTAAAIVSYTHTVLKPMLRVRHHLGTDDQAADTALMADCPDWTASDRGRGLCYSIFTFDLEEPEFQTGPPQPTARIRGRKVYDPRKDGTRPGGSGAHRVDNKATWEWTRNNALCTNDFVRAEFGKRAGANQQLWDTVVAAANACDGTITVDGTAVPRYICDGMFRTDEEADVTLDQLCQSMAGFATFTGGWHYQAGVYTAPVMALTDADNAGAVEVVPSPAANEVLNGLRGRFYSPDAFNQVTDYPPYQNTAFVAEDGGEYWDDLNLPYTATAWRAHNLARIQVERSRGMQLVYPAKLRALKLKPGQRVTLTNTVLNLVGAVFRVVKREYQVGGPVKLTLTLDDATFYDEVDAPATLLPPGVPVRDPFLVDPVAGLVAVSDASTLVRYPDGSARSGIRLLYDASTDVLVLSNGALQVELRLDSADEWTRAPEASGASTSVALAALEAERVHVLRARWRNGLGAYGDWRSATVLAQGERVPPDDVQGFRVEFVAGGARLLWARCTNAHYLHTELHFEATWSDATPPRFRGDATESFMPWPTTGSYVVLAKHRSSTGRYSVNAARVAFTVTGTVVTNASATWFNDAGVPAQWLADIVDPESEVVIGYAPAQWLAGPIDMGLLWSSVGGPGRPQDNATRNVIYRQAADPTLADSVANGDFWFDTDDQNRLYLRIADTWVDTRDGGIQQAILAAGDALAAADGKIASFYQATAPSEAAEGDIWFDTDDGFLQYRYTAGVWVVAADTRIGQAINDAADAQATADGKVVTFVEPTAPTAEAVGDLWLDSDDGYRMRRWNGTAWADVQDAGIAAALLDAAAAQATADGKIESFYQATAPGGAAEGDIWFDTDDGFRQYRYTAGVWVVAADTRIGQAINDAADAQATADGKVVTFVQATAPTAEAVGDLWLDSDDGYRMRRWNGTVWADVRDAGIAAALLDAAGAQATADGKIESFYQATAPGGAAEGDIWFDTDDGFRQYRYTAGVWVVAADTRIGQAINDAADAQATADGKVVTFVQATAPTAEAVGDLWLDTDDGNKLYRWSGSAWVALPVGTGALADGAATEIISDTHDFGGTVISSGVGPVVRSFTFTPVADCLIEFSGKFTARGLNADAGNRVFWEVTPAGGSTLIVDVGGAPNSTDLAQIVADGDFAAAGGVTLTIDIRIQRSGGSITLQTSYARLTAIKK